MDHTLILNQVYNNLIHTIAAFVILAATYFLLFFIIRNKSDSGKNKKRFKRRLFYVLSFIFIIILVRIWVAGFTHLITVLGLVSAALVVTNKESIMNLTGCLIILWRGLFTEDDFIEIQNHKGYVRRISPFYFTISEMSSVTDNHISGRITKLPNSLVITNAVTNHSHQSYLMKMHMVAIFKPNTPVAQAKELFLHCIEQVLAEYCTDHPEYTEESIFRKHKHLKDLSYLKPSITLKAKFDKPSGIVMQVTYFCYSKDQEYLEKQMWETFLITLKDHPEIQLTFDGH